MKNCSEIRYDLASKLPQEPEQNPKKKSWFSTNWIFVLIPCLLILMGLSIFFRPDYVCNDEWSDYDECIQIKETFLEKYNGVCYSHLSDYNECNALKKQYNDYQYLNAFEREEAGKVNRMK